MAKTILKALTFWLLASLSVLMVPESFVRAAEQGIETVTLFYNYDVTTAGYTYGAYSSDPTILLDPLDNNGMPVGKPTPVKTSGSVTTVAAVTASSAPFLYPQIQDLLIANLPFTANNLYKAGENQERASQRVERLITAHASNDSVTVDTAIDLGTSTNIKWKKFFSGTTANDGWFPVKGFMGVNFIGEVKTINATSLDFDVECKAGATPSAVTNQVYTKNFTSATFPNNTTAYSLPAEYAPYEFCRVGWKINTDTGVQSVSAHVVVVR